MGSVLAPALPAVISGLTLAVVTALAAYMRKELGDFRKEHKVLLESQRNQLKATIVQIFERAQERGWITAMELETLNRMADSYFALGGNNYVHAIVDQANKMQIRGELPL